VLNSKPHATRIEFEKQLVLSEKYNIISYIMSRPKSQNSTDAKILKRIRRKASGSILTPLDFLDIGSRAAVDQALLRLVRRGLLRREGRGLYGLPASHTLLGDLAANPEEIAKALARRGAQKIQAGGALAANLLGLSDQVPARMEYLTDGPTRRATVCNLPITLKRTTPRRLATAGRASGTVAQALRFLRRPQVDGSVIAKLRGRLDAQEKRQLIEDIPLVPEWIGEVFRKVAAP
jgi:hypothetical protein